MRPATVSLAAFLCIVSAAPAVAQAEAVIADVWDRFAAHCGAALDGPEAMSRSLSTAPDLRHSVTYTPDNALARVIASDSRYPVGINIYATSAAVEGQLVTSCQVSWSQYEKSPQTPPMWLAAFKAEVVRRGNVTFVGGVLPVHDAIDDNVAYGFTSEFDSYDFVLTGVFPKRSQDSSLMLSAGVVMLSLASKRPYDGLRFPDRQSGGSPAPVAGPAVADAGAAEKALQMATAICLSNYRASGSMRPVFDQAGFSTHPNGKGFEATSVGVNAKVTPGPDGSLCEVVTAAVSRGRAQAIARQLADTYFPGKVESGTPEGTGACPAFSIFAPQRLIIAEFLDAGGGAGCSGPSGARISLRM